jgi:transcription initiation factor IIF auxiliary subunit
MTTWYYGLADCHGVESFVMSVDELISDMFFEEGGKGEAKNQQFAMCMRAHANQQRHAVVYMVLLEEDAVQEIEKYIEKGEYQKALVTIKAKALETKLGTYATTLSAAKKNWGMIPNPDLDPYHT